MHSTLREGSSSSVLLETVNWLESNRRQVDRNFDRLFFFLFIFDEVSHSFLRPNNVSSLLLPFFGFYVYISDCLCGETVQIIGFRKLVLLNKAISGKGREKRMIVRS